MVNAKKVILGGALVYFNVLPLWVHAEAAVIAPTCLDVNYKYNGINGLCEIIPSEKIKADSDGTGSACNTLGGQFIAGSPNVCNVSGKDPVCMGSIRISFNKNEKACVYDASVRKSNSNYYKRDCFKIIARISELDENKKTGERTKFIPAKDLKWYQHLWRWDFGANDLYVYVTDQSADDEKVDVVPAHNAWFGLNCVPEDYGQDVQPVQVPVQRFEGRALRRGIVYGALVMPYKYYYKDGGFGSSASIGPYIGRRTEFFGGTLVTALTIGVSSVEGKFVGGDGAAQSTQLTALTGAVGGIFEVGDPKNPFRMGLFVGVDRIKKTDSGVVYDKNNQPWLALQFGYDFTDK